jgi:hypothetical protein
LAYEYFIRSDQSIVCYNWYVPVKGDAKTPGHKCEVAEGSPAPEPGPVPEPKVLPKELKDTLVVGIRDQYTFKYVTTED